MQTMIKIEKTQTYGWEATIRGMRNPMNSWDKSDSCFCPDEPACEGNCAVHIGPSDLGLMTKLAAAGNDHGKFLRMITVTVDLTAPLYWWKEFDTYKVGTVANSCSTMHKIQAKEFTIEDFSCEHLMGKDTDGYIDEDSPLGHIDSTIDCLNLCRRKFLETENKAWWWQMIQLLPSSYNQKRTVLLNYAVLKNIYHSRKNHKLDEWHDFCHWIEGLPYGKLITE